jgi:hypothetical protein
VTAVAAGTRLPEREYRRLAGRVKLRSWLSLGWMTLEGGVAIIAWRFTGNRILSETAEGRQKLVAIQFFVLAPLRRRDS